MKYLNHLAVEKNTLFIMSNVMGIEATGRNDAVAEHQEDENGPNDAIKNANEAQERAGITATSAADRFTVLEEALAPKLGIEEKVTKPKAKARSLSGKNAGKIETASSDETAEPARELNESLEGVDANANNEVQQAEKAKSANETLINEKIDAAVVETHINGGVNGVGEGGTKLDATTEATA